MPVDPEYLHLVYEGPFPALLYGRNSRDPNKKGRSVADQLAVGHELCDNHGWPVAGVFKDTGISASRHAKKSRDEFEELLTAIRERKGRIVVAFEASRYYRDLEVYVRLRNACYESDVLLCYNGQVFDLSKRQDRNITGNDALKAEDEAEGIRDRNLRTVRRNAQKGQPHGRVLWGYARRYDRDTGELVEQYEHKTRGPYVLQAMQRVDSGHSTHAVALWLNSEKDAAHPGGLPWTALAVKRMLLNPGYIGKRVFQGKVTGDATWPPIKGLDTAEGRAMYTRVKKKLTDPRRRTMRDSKVVHLLSLIALCGECGDHARLKVAHRIKGKPYYKCSEAFDSGMAEDRLDAYVEQALLAWLSRKEAARAALIPDQAKAREDANAAQELIDAYNEQLDEARELARTFNDKGRPLLSARSLSALEQDLEPRIEEAQKKVEGVTGVSPLVQRLLSAQDPAEVWDGVEATEDSPARAGLTLEQKREAIRMLVTIRLFKASRPGVRAIEPERIKLAFRGDPAFRDQPLPARATWNAPGSGSGNE
ncbi:recombinase family protein [Streptomyces aureus]